MNQRADSDTNVLEWVQAYYGSVLGSVADLKTGACCTPTTPAWLRQFERELHSEVKQRFYGCGFPIPEAIEGATVVDLGCGSGRDAYLLSRLVGPGGRVYGIDMTDAQLEVAARWVDWHTERYGYGAANVSFHRAYMEDLTSLPIAAGSVDVIVSNCAVNLSPRKELVLAEAYRLLRDGGEFYISDVVADRRLSSEIAAHQELYAECLGGAMYAQDFVDLAKEVGFIDPRLVHSSRTQVNNDELQALLGAAQFRSNTYRLFKLPGIDKHCEDYGQLATYDGGMPHVGSLFTLDEHHLFEAGRPERVCGNTFDMLARTRFAKHFALVGDKRNHFGAFDCGATLAADAYRSDAPGSGSCC